MTNDDRPNENPSTPQSEIVSAQNAAAKKTADVQSAVRKMADSKPEQVMEMMGISMMGSMANPFHQKMTTEHISQVLDTASKHDERVYDIKKRDQENDFKEGSSLRFYFFWSFVVCVALICFVCFVFKDQPNVLIPILTGLGGFAGGFLGGWGVGKRTVKKKS